MSARRNGDPGALRWRSIRSEQQENRATKKGTGAEASGTGELNNGSGLCAGEREKINSGTGAPGVMQTGRKTSEEKPGRRACSRGQETGRKNQFARNTETRPALDLLNEDQDLCANQAPRNVSRDQDRLLRQEKKQR
jgi:hypothetical protein